MAIMINLTCTDCGCDFQIPESVSSFACLKCGTEYHLKKAGGIGYLEKAEKAPPSVQVPALPPTTAAPISNLKNEKQANGPSFWWITANPDVWLWETIFNNPTGQVFFRTRRIEENFRNARPGDFIFGYRSSPFREIIALAFVCTGLHIEGEHEGITIEKVGNSLLPRPVSWDLVKRKISNAEPVRGRAQGTLFRLTGEEAKEIGTLIIDRGNRVDLPQELEAVKTMLGW